MKQYRLLGDGEGADQVFNSKGGVNQIYMAQLEPDAAQFLLEQAEVIAEYEDKIIDDCGAVSSISATTREALIKARVGQGTFRAGLIKRGEGKCARMVVSNSSLLVASHIHAWSLADNNARLDTDNDLLFAIHLG